ncbi:hypothetical protein [Cryobacterium roopkundense]|uniref:CYTH domain-containing protein n=1 Tax=Cryobacterium roopkundense TaxID=1001240 RepID=A0A7W8ZVI3_9MICO|nr:hypothetical protein [Cryobacterium roopkundense]MBB5640770.1 hypothetical protein [Cryobacterium roopkundense]
MDRSAVDTRRREAKTEDALRLDGVEIKVSVGSDQIASAESFFALALHEPKRRTIYFCDSPATPDTPALPLFRQGVIIRLRKNKGGADDVTVKLRPCHRWQLTPQWLKADSGDSWKFRVEEDWAGQNKALAASLETAARDREIAEMVDQARGVDLTTRQEDFLEDCAVQPVDLPGLEILGPITATKWTLPYENDHEIAAELWHVTDEMRFLEFSIRVAPVDAPPAQKRFENLFRSTGIPYDGLPETKTQLVLEYLTGRAGT